MKDYLSRISARIPQFQTMNESDLNYIKVNILYLRHAHYIYANSGSKDDQCWREDDN